MEKIAFVIIVVVLVVFAIYIYTLRLRIVTAGSIEELDKLYSSSRFIKFIKFDDLIRARFREIITVDYTRMSHSNELCEWLKSFEKFASSKIVRDDTELIAQCLTVHTNKILILLSNFLQKDTTAPDEMFDKRIRAFFHETHSLDYSQRIKREYGRKFS